MTEFNLQTKKSPANIPLLRPKKSIKTKLTWVIAFAAFLSVLLGGVVIVIEDISQSKEDFANKMALITKTVGNYAALDIEFNDKKAAAESLAKLVDIPSVVNAHLFDNHAEWFISLNSDSEFHKFSKSVFADQQQFVGDLFVVTSAIEFNGNLHGYIQLIAKSTEISQKTQKRLIVLSVIGTILAILGYAIAVWLQGIISRPILALAHTAKEISENPDYSLRVKLESDDELGLLYDSFNKMLDTIEHEQQQFKHVLKELKESEARFSAMFNSIPDAVMFADTERKIRLNNPAVFTMFQYDNEEIIGNTTEMLYPSRDAFIEQGKIRFNKNAAEASLPYEVQYKRKDASVFWTESLGAKVTTSSNEHIGFVGIFRDITDRKRAEDRFFRQQQEQQQILDAMVDAVITIDETGAIKSFSRSAERMFEYTEEEIYGQNIKILMPDNYAKQHDSYLANYLRTSDAKVIGVGRELAGKNKSGKEFPIRLSVAELPIGIDGKRRFIGTCHDISREKQQDEMLQRSQKMDAIGKLTGGIAHDFNNMMGVILGYSQLLQHMLRDEGKALQFVNEINSAGERAKNLTAKLLAFSRKKPIDAESANLNQLLQEIQLMLEKTLTARIALTLDLNENLWPVYIDKSSFIDSVLNMSINALHAMPDGGSLTLKTSNVTIDLNEANTLGLTGKEYVQLTVSDTGVGISPEIQDRLFEPFFSTKGEHGTGLGLSQVYGFVQQSKGAIQVFSRPGQGSCFVLLFPRLNNLVAPIQHKVVDSNENHIGTGTILVVDDEPSLVNLTSEILTGKGYKVLTAYNGKEALEVLSREKVDLVLSDVIMPKMDGYQLANVIQEKYPEIKIQLASGYNDNMGLVSIDNNLQRNLLHKPYSTRELLERIKTLMSDK